MSKAFTKEDDGGPPAARPVPRRAALPHGQPNYVTRRGLAALRVELDELVAERARLGEQADAGEAGRRLLDSVDARRRELEERIATAELVDPPPGASEIVRFGARVQVQSAAGETRAYQIVGVDEADAAAGLVAFVSPLARALLGRRVGDTALVAAPRGEEELTILGIAYPP